LKTSKPAKTSPRAENSVKTARENLTQNSEKTLNRRLANLRPWKPGQSGNPGGRPKAGILSQAYHQFLEELDPKRRRTLAEAIAKAIIAKAMRGDVKAASELADRTEGKPQQSLAINATVNSVQDLSDDELQRDLHERLERLKQAVAGRVAATANNRKTARGNPENLKQ